MNLDYYVTNLNVLYEDNHLLVVQKDPNVLSQKDSSNDLDMTEILKEYLRRKYHKLGNVYLGLIHRLDRRVGGVLVCTKTSKAAARLSEDIKNHQIKKKYLALVLNTTKESESFTDYLVKDENKKLAIITNENSPNSQIAKLNYQTLKQTSINNKTHSYIEVDLETGRYNQIRAQMAYHNHPIFNDYKYGYPLKGNELGLWCYKMEITHPITKEKLEFTSIPKGNIWKELGDKNEG